MSLLYLAVAAVAVVVVAVFALVYWHESRRPELRPRPGAPDLAASAAAAADQDAPGRRGPG